MKEKHFTTKMKCLLLGLLMVVAGQNLMAQTLVPVGGVEYPTLTQAFADINTGNLTGDIELQIIDNTVESETAVLYQSGYAGTSSYTSVKIYPTVTGKSITGEINGPLIQLFSTNNVTFDGRLNQAGSSVDLTIINIAPGNQTGLGGASTINFYSSASNNVVQYCTIIGAQENTNKGVIYFSNPVTDPAYVGDGNDNNVIDHNNITGNGPASRPINCIYSKGLETAVSDNITISNNNFYNFLRAGASSNGVNLNAYTTTSTVTGNSFFDNTTFAPNAVATYIPIFIQSTTGNGFTITGNYIGGSSATCGGTWTKTNSQNNIFYGIELELGTGSATNVQNNTIKNFSWSNSGSAAWTGIQVASGDVNIGTTSANTIGDNNTTGSVTVTGGATGTNVYGINILTTGTVNCQNNAIGSINAATSDAANASNIIGINKAAGIGTTTISGNTIGSTSVANSLNATSIVTDANDQSVIGINNAGSGTITISNNTIANLTNGTTLSTSGRRGYINGITSSDGTNTIATNTIYNLTIANGNTAANPASVAGIGLTGLTLKTVTGNTIHDLSNTYASFAGNIFGVTFIGDVSGANEFSGNTIYNLSATGGTAGAAKITGLNFNVGTGANLVKNNYIYGLSVASGTTGTLNGIKIAAGATTYSNNIINLGGNTTTTINGIYETGAVGNNNTLVHNTVYIGGNVGSGSNKSYALYSAVNTNTRNIGNNIFANTRSTTGGSNLHYAAYIVTTGGTINFDYNDYYVSGTGGTLGYYGANKTTLPIVTSQDGHSATLDPLFTTAGGTAVTDYHIKSNLIGLTGTGVSTDYLLASRSSVIPTMGALEDHNYWTGTTDSNDWNTPTNWSKNVVPLSGDNVIFDLDHGNIKNHCQLDATRIVNSIYNDQSTYRTVLNAKHLTVKGALAFTNGAQVDASATTSILEFNGTALQTIPSGSLYNNDVYDLTINNTSNVILKGTANLLHTLTATAGKLDAITQTPTFVYKGSGVSQTLGTNQFLNDQIYNLTINNATGVTLDNTNLTTVTHTFTIETTGKLTIPVNRQLTAAGTTDNRGGVTGLIIHSNWDDVDVTQQGTGSLIVTGAAIGSGTVERYMHHVQWHLVSAPAIEDLYNAGAGFLPRNLAIPYWNNTPANLGIAQYDVANNVWKPYLTNTSATGIKFTEGQGYLVRTARYDGVGGSGTDHGPTVLNFQGTLTSSSKTYTLSRTGQMGWNCIGNPFTSAITLYDGGGAYNAGHLDNFMDVNWGIMDDVYTSAYVLDGTTGAYETVNYANNSPTYLALGQGFLIKAKTNGTSASFTQAMQSHRLESATPFKAGQTSWPSIKLNAAFGASSISTDIKFIDGTTTGLDKGYDAGLFRTDAPDVLYTRLVQDMGVAFQLQCLPANQYNSLIIPVGIESVAGGEVTFSAEALNLDAGCNVILEDKLTMRFTDLTRGTYKTLILPNTVSTDRFFLHTADIMSGIGDQTIGSLNAYAFNNSEIRIVGEVGSNATANLYDVLGRLVVSHILADVNYNVISIPAVKKGVYLLNIVTKDTTKTIKVMVRN